MGAFLNKFGTRKPNINTFIGYIDKNEPFRR